MILLYEEIQNAKQQTLDVAEKAHLNLTVRFEKNRTYVRPLKNEQGGGRSVWRISQPKPFVAVTSEMVSLAAIS